MTSNTTAYHQIGKLIFLFQHVEAEVKDILVLLAQFDDEMVRKKLKKRRLRYE